MPLVPGARLGPYEIVAAIGAGGMGEVYRARDTRLDRDVAIKVLPDLFASDPERLARFEREAKTLAALNHPNIAHLHGLEESGVVRALVMEFVDGEELAGRLSRGPIPLFDALSLAKQVAEALEAAHEQGIIHRDLKPANIKVREDGTVKVLDFGLAKALDVPSGGSAVDAMNSPTLTLRATQLGVILGTAAYMSPEQARGVPADRRADLWAFGVVLWEMLTGRRLFDGATVSDSLAAVLKTEPDVTALPPETPAQVRRLLNRCLEKDRKRRLSDAATARIEIEEALAAGPDRSAATRTPAIWRGALPIAITAAAFAGVGGLAVWSMSPDPAPKHVVRFTVPLDEGVQFTNPGRQLVALSPDGTKMVFVANSRLYLHSMAGGLAEPIRGTDLGGAILNPVFSPDGQHLAFWTAVGQGSGTLRRIAIGGGPVTTICEIANPYGMSWADGTLFLGQGARGIVRVPDGGGSPETIVTVQEGELAHGPQLLPDGDTVLFTLATSGPEDFWSDARIVAHSLRSGTRRPLLHGGTDARYVDTGHILYAVGGTLFALPFDPAVGTTSSRGIPILEGVRRAGAGSTGTAQYAISASGTLAYIPGPAGLAAATTYDLALLDRKGGLTLLNLPRAGYETPRISPDGAHIAVAAGTAGASDIWVYDLNDKTAIRKLTIGGNNRFPVWTADSMHITFQSDREGDLAMFHQRADGSAPAERLTRPEQNASHVPQSWTTSGLTLLYSELRNGQDALWTMSLKNGKGRPLSDVQGVTNARISAEFSPDGRWVAYSGTRVAAELRVLVQPFPSTGAKYDIGRGLHPLWSRDGRELFFSPRGRFVGVPVETSGSLRIGNPIDLPAAAVNKGPTTARNMDVMPDGRFLIVVDAGRTEQRTDREPIQVVLNWFEELKARVPAGK